MTRVYLSLGRNIGDREAYLSAAVEALRQLEQTRVTAVSSLYETAAWGKTDQDDFLNICCELNTSLSPQVFLQACQTIERDLDRVRHEHWGPRTIDIDILIYGNEKQKTEELTLPHPYMTERAFVLVPLAEIAPNLLLDGKDLVFYLGKLEAQEVRKVPWK